jgi:hypothetical protein
MFALAVLVCHIDILYRNLFTAIVTIVYAAHGSSVTRIQCHSWSAGNGVFALAVLVCHIDILFRNLFTAIITIRSFQFTHDSISYTKKCPTSMKKILSMKKLLIG